MRKDDTTEKTYFRSEQRVFRMNEAYYFASREGEQGPYDTQNRAERELERYVNEQQALNLFQTQRHAKGVERFEKRLRSKQGGRWALETPIALAEIAG